MSQVRIAARTLGVMLFAFAVCISFAAPLSAQDDAADNYNHKCAVCHGKDGSGSTAMGKSLHVKPVKENMKDSEAAMIKIVTDGNGEDMDAFKSKFTADQIKALVEYYRGLAK